MCNPHCTYDVCVCVCVCVCAVCICTVHVDVCDCMHRCIVCSQANAPVTLPVVLHTPTHTHTPTHLTHSPLPMSRRPSPHPSPRSTTPPRTCSASHTHPSLGTSPDAAWSLKPHPTSIPSFSCPALNSHGRRYSLTCLWLGGSVKYCLFGLFPLFSCCYFREMKQKEEKGLGGGGGGGGGGQQATVYMYFFFLHINFHLKKI